MNQQVVPAPVVRAVTASNKPAKGIGVEFVLSGGGTVAHRSVTTDNNGEATVGSWTLGTVARQYLVTARVPGVAPVVFTALAAPGPVHIIEALGGNLQLANAGDAVPQPLSVVVMDLFRNRVPAVPVTFSVLAGGGIIAGAETLTDAAGIATSGTWTLGSDGGVQRAKARSKGVETVFTATSCDQACQNIQLLFVRDGSFFLTKLGGGTTQLTFSGYDNWPARSPDGNRIAFTRYEPDTDLSDVYVMNTDGSHLMRLVKKAETPSWSPDGQRLAVSQSGCAYTCEVRIANANDTTQPAIVIASMAANPAWSPDGARIAFVSLSGDDGYHELRTMNIGGSGVSVVSPRDPASIGRVSWSPDGTRIAFAKCWNAGCDIYVALADGSGVTQLTNVGNASDPAWSPDGTRLAISLTTLERGRWDASIALITSEGGEPMQVIPHGWNAAWITPNVLATTATRPSPRLIPER